MVEYDMEKSGRGLFKVVLVPQDGLCSMELVSVRKYKARPIRYAKMGKMESLKLLHSNASVVIHVRVCIAPDL
jgi:hypothetical protein